MILRPGGPEEGEVGWVGSSHEGSGQALGWAAGSGQAMSPHPKVNEARQAQKKRGTKFIQRLVYVEQGPKK